MCCVTHPSITTSVCHVTSPSVMLPAPTVCQLTRPHVTLSVHHTDTSICRTTCHSVCHSTCKSVTLSVHNMASPSIIPVHPSYDSSVHHPVNSSMTHQSVTQPVSSAIHPSDHLSPSDCLHTILPCPSGCPTSSDSSSTMRNPPGKHRFHGNLCRNSILCCLHWIGFFEIL